jgi:predicted NAD/FAD-binding protein
MVKAHPDKRQRVAVIGGGIAGLGSAWLLADKHEVTLFEAADYAGGHTNTVDLQLEGQSFAVDTGFWYSTSAPTQSDCAVPCAGRAVLRTDMSFSVSLDRAGRMGGQLAGHRVCPAQQTAVPVSTACCMTFCASTGRAAACCKLPPRTDAGRAAAGGRLW